jgi:hypothetical protein
VFFITQCPKLPTHTSSSDINILLTTSWCALHVTSPAAPLSGRHRQETWTGRGISPMAITASARLRVGTGHPRLITQMFLSMGASEVWGAQWTQHWSRCLVILYFLFGHVYILIFRFCICFLLYSPLGTHNYIITKRPYFTLLKSLIS